MKKVEDRLTSCKGVLVFHVDIASMSPANADVYVERVKENYHKSLKDKKCKMPDNVGVIFMPTRTPPEKRVEYISFGDFIA